MFGAPVDDRFLNQPAPASPRGRPVLILTVLALIGGFFLWAATHEIEEVARATGRVVPSQRVQAVQSLEGGIVARVLVAEGDVVEAGQPMLEIDATAAASDLGALREQSDALMAQQARLRAEADGRDPAFPDTLPAPMVAREQALFDSRRAERVAEEALLADRITQRAADLTEQQAVIAQLEAQIAPLQQELALSEDMLTRGVMPELEVLRLRARVAELTGALGIAQAALPRLRAAITEARAQVAAASARHQSQIRTQLADVDTRAAVVRETLTAAQDRLSRTTLVAPVRGTVNRLLFTAPGAVVAPGAALAEIVPSEDGLLIEADLAPRDIAFVSAASTASVRITAYDAAIYGALPATIERISADALVTAEGVPVFRVTLRTARTHLGPEDAPLPIIPGMVAAVDIQTGRKTVLDYLMKPVLRARDEALRER